MDKYEYKIRSEEIKELIAQREYARAAEIADGIDWRRVKSVMMLCTISDLYKINKRYEDSRDLLLLAYDRNPTGRTIVYALCELSIKMGELVQASEYWDEFVNIAPRDPGRYILRYKIYEAQGVNLEERAAVLEELKKHDYREKWGYELAYLYHRMGLVSKCVDECDELIIWFGEGKYVIRAMELKMLHQPLTPQQQEKYDSFFAPVEEVQQEVFPVEEEVVEEDISQEPVEVQEEAKEEISGSTSVWSGQEVAGAMETAEAAMAATRVFPTEEIDIQVKTLDPTSQYNTINLQQEVAAGIQEILAKEAGNEEIIRTLMEPMMQTDRLDGEEATRVINASKIQKEVSRRKEEAEQTLEENTRVWSSEEVKEVEEENTRVWSSEEVKEVEENTRVRSSEEVKEVEENTRVWSSEEVKEVEENTRVRSSEEIKEVEENTRVWNSEEVEKVAAHNADLLGKEEEITNEAEDTPDLGEAVETIEKSDLDIAASKPSEEVWEEAGDIKEGEAEEDKTAQIVMAQMRKGTEEPPKEIAEVISMEGDGQFRFFVPEKAMVEQQVSGQLSIDDIMAEWERVKKELEEKNKEKLVQRVKENTNPMFNEFEASLRDDLLDQLENGRSIESVIAEAEGKHYEEEEIPVPVSLQEDVAEGEDYEAISPEEAENAVEWVLEEETVAEDDEAALVEEFEQLIEEMEQEDAIISQEDVIGPDDVVEELEELEEIEDADTKEEKVQEDILIFESESEEESSEEASDGFVIEDISDEEEFFEKSEMINTEDIVWEDTEDVPEEYVEDEVEEVSEESDNTEEETAHVEREEIIELEDETADETQEEIEEVAETTKTQGEETAKVVKKRPKKLRNLTKEERELFGPFIQGKTSKAQLIHAIDNISMAAYTGNVIITGVEGLDTLGLAKSIIQEVQMTDSNFSGKIAKISGEALNKRKVSDVLSGLQNGALIIQNAYQMNVQTAKQLYKELQLENLGIIVIMEGLRKKMNAFMVKNAMLKECFTARIDMETLSNNDLVGFAQKYAEENEFTMDEMAKMELHRLIEERQTNDHAVTIMEVKEIMDEAMDSASRKSLGHFFDILTGKRYDEEDMIVIKSKDFR